MLNSEYDNSGSVNLLVQFSVIFNPDYSSGIFKSIFYSFFSFVGCRKPLLFEFLYRS